MKICGIELKSNYAILTIIESTNEKINYVDLKVKKITLTDDEDKNSVLHFIEEVNNFFINNYIEEIVIKKRSKKGAFSGGAVTFKMEGLIQQYSHANVSLVSAQSISSYERKNDFSFPDKLKKYQEQSYLVILTYLKLFF